METDLMASKIGKGVKEKALKGKIAEQSL